MNTDFDIMVIAILNTTIAKQVKEWYVQLDVEAGRIDYITLQVLDETKLPFV